MEEEKNLISLDSNNITATSIRRELILILSSIDDVASIHTHIKRVNSSNEADPNQSESSRDEIEECTDIVDICKLASKLTSNKINELVIETLAPGTIDSARKELRSVQQNKFAGGDNFQIDDENESSFGLMERLKHQKLSNDQYKFLKKELEVSNENIYQLSTKYNISTSLLIKIKHRSWQQINNMSNRDKMKVYGENKHILRNEIWLFIKNCEYSFTTNDVTQHVNLKLNTNYPVKLIRTIMKNELNLSYKKVKSRPNSIDLNKVESARILFSIKFAQIVNSNTLVLNMGASSINRNTKHHYSWSLKGTQKEVKNIPFVGSASIIAWILSNGAWFSLITNSTVDSTKFVMFLENLKEWLKKNDTSNYSNTLFLLDNWSIHKSEKNIRKLRKMRTNILYLPPYSPNFAPVEEFFGIMKAHINKQWAKEIVKLNTKTNYEKIVRSLKTIKSDSIRKMFRNLYSQLRTYIK